MSTEEDDIKWIDEYPALKQVNPVSPFKVSSSYFDEMEGQVMGQINLLNLTQYTDKEFFTVPENYFDGLSQNIQSRIAIEELVNQNENFIVPENYLDELSQNIQSRIAIDELVGEQEGFTVSENYFDELSQNIQSRIAIDKLVNQSETFTVPENYFDGLSQNIQSRIAIEELINADQSFTVPESYFDELQSRILSKTTGVEPVQKDYAVVRKLWANKAFKYATAACFSLFIGSAIFISEFNETNIRNTADLHKALSKIPDSDIETYLQLNSDAPSILENTDDGTLNNLEKINDNKVN